MAAELPERATPATAKRQYEEFEALLAQREDGVPYADGSLPKRDSKKTVGLKTLRNRAVP